MTSRKIKKGFTLIELLVVISIIALLLAILVPSLVMAKDRMRTIICRNNLKQYGLSTVMYLDENDGFFPRYNAWLSENGGELTETNDEPDGAFWPYISSYDVHLCPVWHTAIKAKANDVQDYTRCMALTGNYVMNSYLGCQGAGVWGSWIPGATGVEKITEVHRPSGVMVFSEENGWAIQEPMKDALDTFYSKYPWNDLHFTVGDSTRKEGIDNFATYHNAPGGDYNRGLANLVFADGSVTYVERAETTAELDRNFRLTWPKKRKQ